MAASLITLAALASGALAKTCVNVTVPVDIMARQGVFDVPAFQGNLDATTFAQNFTSIRGNFTDEALVGYQTVTGSYNISAKYCRPDGAVASNPTVQVLSHGIGFDKTYWDLSFNNYNYSYVDAALAAGFHTVAIDRFGIGNSSHGDPLNLIQAPAEVSALNEVTKKLRAGTFPQVSTTFKKVVHVGHSFGSAQTYLLTALYPSASDGIILTGFSMNATWVPVTVADWNLHIARLNQPFRFGNVSLANVQKAYSMVSQYGSDIVNVLDMALAAIGIDVSSQDVWNDIATTEVGNILNNWNGTVPGVPQDLPNMYLTWPDLTANQFAFLYPGHFDLALALVAESTKQPVTVGEVFTLANGAPKVNSFTGPVQIVTGQQDAIYCGGDCFATGDPALASIPAAVKMNFPSASAFEAYIQPNTGHGINAHYNSTGAYQVMQNWLQSNNLESS